MTVEKYIKISDLTSLPYDPDTELVGATGSSTEKYTAEDLGEKIFDNFAYVTSSLQTTAKIPTEAINEVLAGITGAKLFIGQTVDKMVTFTDPIITTSSIIKLYADQSLIGLADLVITSGSVTIKTTKNCNVKAVIY